MYAVPASLPEPSVADLVTRWAPQPLMIAAVLLCGLWYARGVRRLPRGSWPVRRAAVFGCGLVAALWVTSGFPQVYASSLYWVWTSQSLALLLVVPIVVLAGQPMQLARRFSGRADRLLRMHPVRLLGSPLVGPALVPLLSVVLFFGPLAGWAIEVPPLGWLVQLVIVVLGALIVLPLVGIDDGAGSLAVGLSLGIGIFELILDAIPGIVLRLQRSLVTGFFDQRAAYAWTPSALHDQQVAGAILWCVSELIDLPFLVLVYRRWLRADAREAAEVDAVLEAERSARRALVADTEPAVDAPWWLTDPVMKERFRRQT